MQYLSLLTVGFKVGPMSHLIHPALILQVQVGVVPLCLPLCTKARIWLIYATG